MLYQHDIHLMILVHEKWMNYFDPTSCWIASDMHTFEPTLPWMRSNQKEWFLSCNIFALRLFCQLSMRSSSKNIGMNQNKEMSLPNVSFLMIFVIIDSTSFNILLLNMPTHEKRDTQTKKVLLREIVRKHVALICPKTQIILMVQGISQC